MIGVNDQSDEIFEPTDASQLLTFAESVGMGEISMWSLARDQEDPAGALSYAEDDSSSIIQSPLEFSDIFTSYILYV
jgi:chitinase